MIVDAVTSGRRSSHRLLLDGPSATLALPAADAVVLNAGGHGFYRSRYEREGLAALTTAAQELLAPIERYNLIDDAYAAMLAGQVRAADVLALCQGLGHDDDLSVWQRISGALTGLSRLLHGDDLERFAAVVRSLALPALDIVGWLPADGEGDRQRELRATLFSLAGTIGNDATIAERAAALHRDGTGDPSLGAAAVTVLAHVGGAARWEEFRQRIGQAGTPQEVRRYTFALADFPDWSLTETTLRLCLDGSIKSQDGPFVVARAISNRDVSAAAWGFVEANWNALNERFPSNTISRMVGTITTITDPALANAVASFLDAHPVPQGAKTVAQNREKMGVMVALAEREAAALAAALR